MDYRKYSLRFILFTALLTGLSIIPLQHLKFDFSIENFFPVDDPDLEFFTEFQDRFFTQVDDEFIFIAIRNEEGIFNEAFLSRADSITRHVSRMKNILAVYSITNIPLISYDEGRIVRQPLVHTDNPELYRTDSIQVYNSSEFRDLMLSRDGKSTAITALNRPGISEAEKDELLNNINVLLDNLELDRSHVVAKIKLERTYIQEIAKNLSRYLAVSLLLIAVLLFFIYRSVIGVVIPLFTVVVAICLTLAMMAALGFPVDIISSLLPPVLAVICMSDIIHVTTKYKEERLINDSKTTALKNTFSEIGMATFFTSVTTAAGFYSLCVSNVLPIRSFGFFAGSGVLIAFVVALGAIMSSYTLLSGRKLSGPPSNPKWAETLNNIHDGIMRRKTVIVLAAALLLVPSALFISRIQINSSLLQELPKNNPILDDYAFIESEFSGTRSYELALTLNDTSSSFLNLGILRDIEKTEQFLKDSMGVGNIFSPVTFINGAHRALSSGQPEDWRLPDYQADVYVCYDKLILSPVGKDMLRYITQDGKHARIGGKLPNLTIKEIESLNRRFAQHFESNSGSMGFDYKLTGSALLIDKVSYSLVRNLFTGLAIGFLVISLIVISMFRSIRIVLIVLICNIIPLILVAALMGAMNIFLKADTAIIFAISFGIVVDDSIHFINRFRLERSKGIGVEQAVRQTYVSTGKAMITTTLVLLAGFVSLVFSSFGGTYYIGLLVSACLAIALIIDLTLLPVLLVLFAKDRHADSKATQGPSLAQ